MKIHNRYLVLALCLTALPLFAQELPTKSLYKQACIQSETTQYAQAVDGTRIAFDVSGHGPTLILLHGGGQSRRTWHEIGYVSRLKIKYQVITIDLRAHGESDRPTDSAAYTTDKVGQDILAVADACGVQNFVVWGFSYGGNVGRYLAAQSERMAGMVIMGIPFGMGASGDFRTYIEYRRDHWMPILQAQRDNKLDWDALSERDRASLRDGHIASDLAWQIAMLEWPEILPKDMRCPTLWLMGSKNEVGSLSSLKEHKASLPNTKVKARVIDGLTHGQEQTHIDKVLPAMLAFTQATWSKLGVKSSN